MLDAEVVLLLHDVVQRHIFPRALVELLDSQRSSLWKHFMLPQRGGEGLALLHLDNLAATFIIWDSKEWQNHLQSGYNSSEAATG